MGLAVIPYFFAYFAELTALRRAHPTADLASMVAHATIDGRPLEDVETFGYYLIVPILWAMIPPAVRSREACSPRRNTPSNGTRYGADTAVVVKRRRGDRAVGQPGETLHCARPTYRGSCRARTIAPGDWVLLSYQSANRDEAVFTDPFRFYVSRRDAAQSLGFGFGRHSLPRRATCRA